MTTFKHYLFNNLLSHFLAIFLVFEVVISVNLLSRLLSRIVEGRYPLDVLASFWFYTILDSWVFVLPFVTMLAVMLTFTRKYYDGEMYVMFSLGIGYRQLFSTVMRLVLPLTIFSLVLVMNILPTTNMHYKYLKETVKKSKDVNVVTPGKFIDLGNNTVLFVENHDREAGRLDNLFIARKTQDELIIETALHGIQKIENGEKRLYLYTGRRYQGIPEETYFQISQFQEHWIVLPPAQLRSHFDEADVLKFSRLLNSTRLEDQAEIQLRLAMPISLILLAVFALLLSQTQPRHEQYMHIAGAIITCLIYLNANKLIGELIASGDLPEFPGVWSTHFLMVIVIFILFWRRGVFNFKRHVL